jgi:hypothetical protein
VRIVLILVAIGAALATGCNSSMDSGSGSGTTTNASATGLWSGMDSTSGLGLTALINAAGQAVFIRSDGVQFFGTVQVSGNTLAMTVDGYSDFPQAFSDGSTSGLGTVDGTVTSGASITATLSFTTTANTAITGSWSLTFETLANDSSSTSTVSGNYTDNVTGSVLAISSSGVMSSQNANNGCVLNGAISTADSSHDVYEVSYTYGNCTSTYAVLNGVQFTGLATLNPNSSPAQLTMAASGAATSGTKYAIESTLTAG